LNQYKNWFELQNLKSDPESSSGRMFWKSFLKIKKTSHHNSWKWWLSWGERVGRIRAETL